MFRQIRYQTGELQDIMCEMKKGNIPCMDVDNTEELDWFIAQLAKENIHKAQDLPYDKNARDRVKEPEFEFRIAFCDRVVKSDQVDKEDLMYIDFYFEPDVEETYDAIMGD